jgi:hypothetical protein
MTYKANVTLCSDEPTSSDSGSRTSWECFYIYLSLPSLYGHRAAIGHGQLGEKNVVDVSFWVSGLEYVQFCFDCHREDSSVSFVSGWLGSRLWVCSACNLGTYCETIIWSLWASVVLRPRALQSSCGYVTEGNTWQRVISVGGRKTISVGYFVYITFVSVFS